MRENGPTHPLRRLRQNKLWSQDELAERSEVARRTIQNIEGRMHQPTMEVRRKLLATFRIPIGQHEDIFGRLPEEF